MCGLDSWKLSGIEPQSTCATSSIPAKRVAKMLRFHSTTFSHRLTGSDPSVTDYVLEVLAKCLHCGAAITRKNASAMALFVPPIGRRGGSTRRTQMIGIPKWISRSNEARIGFARVATALAFMSVGALAVGALAVGRLAIGKLVLKNGQIDRLSIDELQVNVLRVREQIVENSKA
jgi:hypothetical protein